jgi:DNA modification methylase
MAVLMRPQVMRPVGELKSDPRNARKHSPDQLRQLSLAVQEFGWTQPVLVDESGQIIAGHARVQVASNLGLEQVPVVVVDGLTDTQRQALAIADNQLALGATWDEGLLRELLAELDAAGVDLTGAVGFGWEELDALLGEDADERDPDDVPELPEQASAVAGRVWQLGAHRLVCGDATHRDVYQLLLQDETVHAVWTDPPYNVAYEGRAGKIANDDLSGDRYRALLDAAFGACYAAMGRGAPIYVAHADREALAVLSSFKSAGFKQAGIIIWRKNSLVLGRLDYQQAHEPVLYGWKPGIRHPWWGGRKQTTVAEYGPPFEQRADGSYVLVVGDRVLVVQGDAQVEASDSTVLEVARPRRSDEHPTMKPVALIERMLKNSCRPMQRVLDPFGGSGSTLIACERLGLSARLIELEPRYCDVIVARWEQYTGGRAEVLT